MIGDRYDVDKWNCTHEVSQWYRLNNYPHQLQSVNSSEWGVSFVRWMRKRFTPLVKPEQGALVLMKNRCSGGLHVGVWDNGMVHHCYQPPGNTPGQTIRTPLSIIKCSHKDVTFWRMKNV
ncbi:hypothetical protein S10a_00094 [Klebsiella phage VLCpiS10a]|nr:hypothetical protein S10a_00094 [Klebsiella phage VLCpiS10a]UWF98106.1 MAG: Protein of unknown function (DUF1175) [Bacteriophage sp.]UYL04978.1 hypothetical protein LGIDLPPJ_00091 [Klebsiella phage KP13-27]